MKVNFNFKKTFSQKMRRFFRKISFKLINIRVGLSNLRYFFTVIWKYRTFDYTFLFSVLKQMLERNSSIMDKQVPSSLDKEDFYNKQAIFKEMIFLLNSLIKEDYKDRVGYDRNYEISFKLINDNIKKDDNVLDVNSITIHEQVRYKSEISIASLEYIKPESEQIVNDTYHLQKLDEVINSKDKESEYYTMVSTETTEQKYYNRLKLKEAIELEEKETKRFIELFKTFKHWW